jgi:general secretion pathway protein H
MLKRSRGFTLIEIMLVIVIIGCAVGIVVLSLPGAGSRGDGDIKSQSERLGATLMQTAEQAMMEGRTIGVRIDPQGYQFMVRQPKTGAETQTQNDGTVVATVWDDQVWVPYEKEKLITSGSFPEGTTVELELGGLALDPEESRLGMEKQDWFAQGGDDTNKEPQILLLPGGEITPFKLTLTQTTEGDSADTVAPFMQLRGDESGQVRVMTRADVDDEEKQ